MLKYHRRRKARPHERLMSRARAPDRSSPVLRERQISKAAARIAAKLKKPDDTE